MNFGTMWLPSATTYGNCVHCRTAPLNVTACAIRQSNNSLFIWMTNIVFACTSRKKNSNNKWSYAYVYIKCQWMLFIDGFVRLKAVWHRIWLKNYRSLFGITIFECIEFLVTFQIDSPRYGQIHFECSMLRLSSIYADLFASDFNWEIPYSGQG